MDEYSIFVRRQFRISAAFLGTGLVLGLIYSLQLLGILFGNSDALQFSNARSAHISLMLYGFAPLILTLLPFSVCVRDGVCPRRGLRALNTYCVLWYVFLVFMTLTLLFGTRRNLVFYDFSYELNFILAFAGVFYIVALFRFAAAYEVEPGWLRLTRLMCVVAPVLLVVLMHPEIGPVNGTMAPSHGDNILGMSFGLIPVYYLAIRLHSRRDFTRRGRLLWIIPLAGYGVSLVIRFANGGLLYAQEWFFQYLTLLYIPLLVLWMREARLTSASAPLLYVSILAFLFIDIEGNLLFIPSIRALFHRNDLVIGHAHVAVGLAVFFLAMTIAAPHLRRLQVRRFAIGWLVAFGGMVVALTLAGLAEADLIRHDPRPWWILRSICGALVILVTARFFLPALEIEPRLNRPTDVYHLAGVLSDGTGGILLLLFGPFLYGLAGLPFAGGYQYVVFGFMSGVGLMHLLGLVHRSHSGILAIGTAWMRVLVAATFYALFRAGHLGVEGLAIAGYDLAFALVYFLGFGGGGVAEKTAGAAVSVVGVPVRARRESGGER